MNVSDKVSLITKMECGESGISPEEAGRLIAEQEVEKKDEPEPDASEDPDDLLAQM